MPFKDKKVAKQYSSKRYLPDYRTMTICKCPRCEAKHKKKMFWTGRGMPRKMCSNCRHIMDHREHADADITFDPNPVHCKIRG